MPRYYHVVNGIGFTERKWELVKLLDWGFKLRAAAATAHLSYGTSKTYLTRLYGKVKVDPDWHPDWDVRYILLRWVRDHKCGPECNAPRREQSPMPPAQTLRQEVVHVVAGPGRTPLRPPITGTGTGTRERRRQG